jgi:O-antigen ligase
VQLHEYSAGLSRGGFGRLGSARADSVMVWPPVLMSVFGMAGAVLTVARYETHGNQTRILTWGALAVAALSVPPMAATMTHGAYFGFGLMSVALIAAVAVRAIQRGLTLDEKRRILRLVMAGVIAVAVIVSQNWFGAQDRIVGLWNYYRSERSGGSAAASRTDVWQYSMRTIREHPWLGVRFTGAQEEIPPEYRAKGGYLSHNVFLDYARYAGIPCMLAAAWFFIYPVIQLLRAPERWRYTSFFFAYFVMFIFWMTLSFQFYKTFWGLWMLVAIMAKDHQGTLRGGGRLSKGMAA